MRRHMRRWRFLVAVGTATPAPHGAHPWNDAPSDAVAGAAARSSHNTRRSGAARVVQLVLAPHKRARFIGSVSVNHRHVAQIFDQGAVLKPLCGCHRQQRAQNCAPPDPSTAGGSGGSRRCHPSDARTQSSAPASPRTGCHCLAGCSTWCGSAALSWHAARVQLAHSHPARRTTPGETTCSVCPGGGRNRVLSGPPPKGLPSPRRLVERLARLLAVGLSFFQNAS
jgi:hypothetical protein